MHKPLVNIADASAETIGLLVALGYLVITEDGIHVNEKSLHRPPNHSREKKLRQLNSCVYYSTSRKDKQRTKLF